MCTITGKGEQHGVLGRNAGSEMVMTVDKTETQQHIHII